MATFKTHTSRTKQKTTETGNKQRKTAANRMDRNLWQATAATATPTGIAAEQKPCEPFYFHAFVFMVRFAIAS